MAAEVRHIRFGEESEETRAAVAAGADKTGKDAIEDGDEFDKDAGEQTVLRAAADDALVGAKRRYK